MTRRNATVKHNPPNRTQPSWIMPSFVSIRTFTRNILSNSPQIVRALALGADSVNAARGFMFSLGCIQALKCNTNHCPTGITTQDEDLIKGLDVHAKSHRVKNFHRNTVHSLAEMVGAAGLESPDELQREHIVKRVGPSTVMTYEEMFPTPATGCLLEGKGTEYLQGLWDRAVVSGQLADADVPEVGGFRRATSGANLYIDESGAGGSVRA